MSITAVIILFALLILFLFFGVPISISLGLCAAVGALFSGLPFDSLAARLALALNPPAADLSPLMSIPFFLLMGNIMLAGGISKRLIEFINVFISKTSGGLNYIAIIACAMFSALSGPAPVTVVAVGSTLYPEMTALGYPKSRSAGIFSVAGSLGSIFPPSIIMIVYASIAKVSVTDLFSAGLGIGLILLFALLIICAIVSKSDRAKTNTAPMQKFNLKVFIKSLIKTFPIFVIAIIIFGGIYFKILSAVEAGAVGALYTILISAFLYKSLKLRDLGSALINSIKSSAMILFIIAAANIFSFVLQNSQISAWFGAMALNLNLNALTFCIICAFIVLCLGTIIDGAAICVLLVGALLPIAQGLGVSQMHFAMIICVGAVVGAVTPPVAVNIFAAKTFSGLKIGEIAKGQMPFFLGFLITYILITIFPIFSQFLIRN